MINRNLLIPLWVLIVGTSFFSACHESDYSTQQEEVLGTLEDIIEAFRNRDGEAFISNFSHDADLEGFVQGTPPEVGWQVVKESVEKIFRIAEDIKAEIIDPRVDVYFGRTAVVTYFRKTKVTIEDEPMEKFVRGTVVMVKKVKDWEVVSYHYSDVIP